MTRSGHPGGEAAAGFVSYERMRELHAQGLATTLSRFITDHVRYKHRWWIAERDSWHPVTDEGLICRLNAQHTLIDAHAYLAEEDRNAK